MRKPTRSSQRLLMRRAFTLVEILVVIAIIAILAALSVWGIAAMMGGQQRRNTDATISVLNKLLQSHVSAVVAEAQKDTISPAVMNLASPDPTGERAKILHIKFRLMEAFPQTFAEIGTNLTAPPIIPFVYTTDAAGNPWILPNQRRYITDYQKQLDPNLSIPTQPNLLPNTEAITESSACLRMALSVNRGGSQLTDDMINYALKDIDGDGIKEIVDGWGKPLAFYRFAWNEAVLQAANPGASNVRTQKLADPVDVNGTMINLGWWMTPNRVFFEKQFHSTAWPANNFQKIPAGRPTQESMTAAYVVGVIVSSGLDTKLGLTELNTKTNAADPTGKVMTTAGSTGLTLHGRLQPDMKVQNAGQVADNRFSFQLR